MTQDTDPTNAEANKAILEALEMGDNPMQSDRLDKLIPALVSMQGELEHAPKNKTNPHFKSKYADLADVIGTAKPTLLKYGLAVNHRRFSRNDNEYLLTTLWHVSGQWISSEALLNPVKNDPQGVGAAITYYRRYDLGGILGMATEEDDDGNAASSNPSPFKTAAARKTFCDNVIKSFAEAKTVNELELLSKLNAEMLTRMKESPSEHDHLAVDELRKQYARVKAQFEGRATDELEELLDGDKVNY